MENLQENENNLPEENDNQQNSEGNAPGGVSEEAYNDTGFAGTTNAVSENFDTHDDRLAIEDTMIGYDGDEDQLDMDIRTEDDKKQNNAGVDDND